MNSMQTKLRPGATALLVATLIAVLHNAAFAQSKPAKPVVHPLFSSHMVLQRGKAVPVWGWTKPRTKIVVEFAGQSTTTQSGADGMWSAKLSPMTADATGRTLKISAADGKAFSDVVLDDVLVGDVWICSGQSNMEWPIAASNNAETEIAQGDHPAIRLFTVPKRISLEPQSTVEGSWSRCSPETLPGFSAVGYFFGRELNQELGVPIGLIHTSWGGTIAEAWTSREALTTMDDFKQELEALDATAKEVASGTFDLPARVAAWWKKNDAGADWYRAEIDHSQWKTMQVPANWESANVGMDDFDGIVWFRKEFELPATWQNEDVILSLGAIDDADTTWVNGHRVGGMSLWNQKRNYRVQSAFLKPGKNVIAIRVFDGNGGGGIYDVGHNIAVQLASDTTKSVSLKGPWHFNVGGKLNDLTPFPQSFTGNPNKVTVLYNGMLAPLKPFGITGAIWYQGESNAGRPTQYRRLLPTMIADWRNRFEQGDFPFLVVQLANFMQQQTTPVQSGWAELREAQQMTAARDPNVGLAVITDIGEADDIHPRNKQDVGKRLALQALDIAYDKDVVHSGPTVKDMGVRGDAIMLDFENVGGGLVAKGGKLQGFAIAEAQGEFVWAEGEIDGNTITLWNENLAEPIRARYNWGNNPIGNLFNREGLPAAPFRTDRR